MTRTVKEVRIFISSPSDVKSERAAAKSDFHCHCFQACYF